MTLPLIAPAVLAGGLLAFSLSFDDYAVVTTFNSGVGSSTLPLYIYGRIKFGDPEINAISTIIVAITAIAILIALAGRGIRSGSAPAGHRGGTRRRVTERGRLRAAAVLLFAFVRAAERVAVAGADRGNRTAAMSPSNTSSSSLGWGRRTGAAPSAGN